MSRPPTLMGNYKQVNPRPMQPLLPRPKKLERVYPSEIPDPPLPPEPPRPQPPRLMKEGNILDVFAPSKIPRYNPDRSNKIDWNKTTPSQWMIWFVKHLRSKINREKSFEYKIVDHDYKYSLHVLCKKWFIKKWWYILDYTSDRKDQAEFTIKIFFEFKDQEMIAAYESKNEKRFVIDHSKKKQSGGLSVVDSDIDNGQLSIVDDEEKSIDDIDLLILQKIKNAELELKEQMIKEIKKIKHIT